VLEAWINPNVPIGDVWNGIRLCVNDETEIPARGPFDQSTALDLSCGNVLCVEADASQSRNADAIPIRRAEWVRKWNVGELIALPLELWTLRQFFETALPRGIDR
jgi:hypothetical protein